jgi:hypothetical protein
MKDPKAFGLQEYEALDDDPLETSSTLGPDNIHIIIEKVKQGGTYDRTKRPEFLPIKREGEGIL